jgi:hypothetical protein
MPVAISRVVALATLDREIDAVVSRFDRARSNDIDCACGDRPHRPDSGGWDGWRDLSSISLRPATLAGLLPRLKGLHHIFPAGHFRPRWCNAGSGVMAGHQ